MYDTFSNDGMNAYSLMFYLELTQSSYSSAVTPSSSRMNATIRFLEIDPSDRARRTWRRTRRDRTSSRSRPRPSPPRRRPVPPCWAPSSEPPCCRRPREPNPPGRPNCPPRRRHRAWTRNRPLSDADGLQYPGVPRVRVERLDGVLQPPPLALQSPLNGSSRRARESAVQEHLFQGPHLPRVRALPLGAQSLDVIRQVLVEPMFDRLKVTGVGPAAQSPAKVTTLKTSTRPAAFPTVVPSRAYHLHERGAALTQLHALAGCPHLGSKRGDTGQVGREYSTALVFSSFSIWAHRQRC